MARDKMQLAREAIAEFTRTLRSTSFFADDVVWDFSGFEGWLEDSEYRGREAFDAQVARWIEPFETWSIEILELVDVGGNDVLGTGIQRGVLKGSQAVVEMPTAQIWTVREEKLCRIRIFASREAARAAAGLEPGGEG